MFNSLRKRATEYASGLTIAEVDRLSSVLVDLELAAKAASIGTHNPGRSHADLVELVQRVRHGFARVERVAGEVLMVEERAL